MGLFKYHPPNHTAGVAAPGPPDVSLTVGDRDSLTGSDPTRGYD